MQLNIWHEILASRLQNVALAIGYACNFIRPEAPMSDPDVPQADTSAETPADAERFNQARTAQSLALLEDYTEMIDDLIAEHGEARITDIAHRMGVTHPTATKAVARLKREGLANSRPYRGVFLTEAGSDMAARVRRRHRIVIDVLERIGVPAEAAALDAEGIEHHVSEVTLAAFERFLGTART
jgi:DtxR family transcriptional regulator, manganese transport regulator